MNDKTCGIILTSQDYKENDSLLQVLTREYGVISLIAKGSKKMTSHHHYMPFCVYEFIIDYMDRKTIFTPKGSKLIKSFYDDSIKLLSFMNILSLAYIRNKELLHENEYELLLFILERLNEKNLYLLGSLFFASLLKLSGISPRVDGCVECGNNLVIGLSNNKGGFVCKTHALGNDILDVDRLKKFRLINKADYLNYDLLKDYDFDLKDFSIITDFYIYNSGIKLKAYDFYKTL